MAVTSQRELVSALLETRREGQPLEGFIADRRDNNKSWETITDELLEITDGVVDVHWTTVRRWGIDLGVEAKAAS